LNSATQFLISGGRWDASCTCTLVVIPVPAIVVRHCAPLIAVLSALRRPLLHLVGGRMTDIAGEGRILADALFAHALLRHRRSGHAFGPEYLRSPALTLADVCRLLIALTPSDVCRLLLALTPAAECRLLVAPAYPTTAIVAGHDSPIGKPAAQFG
jgi:hypothetical protein